MESYDKFNARRARQRTSDMLLTRKDKQQDIAAYETEFKSFSQLDEELRENYIENDILKYARQDDIEITHQLIDELMDKYEGAEIFALSILAKATKTKGTKSEETMLDEYMDVLDIFYEKFLKLVPPSSRIIRPYSAEIEKFFIRCIVGLDSIATA